MISFTFRLKVEQREKLRRRAKALGKSESEFLREMLDRELERKPMSATIGHLAGVLSLKPKARDDWREHIRKQNCAPER